MQLGNGRTVVKAHEGMVSDSDKSRRLFHFVVRVQTFFIVIDQLQRVPGRCEREEQVLGDDQNTASTCPLGCFCRPDLREYVVATVRGRRADVLLGPVRRESISESEILVAKDIVGHSPAFRDGSHQIAGTRPGALDQKDIGRERVRLRIVGKIATALWGALRMGYERNRKTNKGEGTRESKMHIQTHSLQEEKNRARHSVSRPEELLQRITVSAGSSGGPAAGWVKANQRPLQPEWLRIRCSGEPRLRTINWRYGHRARRRSAARGPTVEPCGIDLHQRRPGRHCPPSLRPYDGFLRQRTGWQ